MSSLRDLKRRLQSISTTEQLAGAMRTVSAAKYSALNAALASYRAYGDACAGIMKSYGGGISDALGGERNVSRVCYVVITSNRGLCGGYNSALLAYANEILSKCEEEYIVVACGKVAASRFEGKASRAFVLPDSADLSSGSELCRYLLKLYNAGEVSSVRFIYQRFRNMLIQTPCEYTLLPLDANSDKSADKEGAGEISDIDEALYIPDRETVFKKAALQCANAAVYSVLSEASAGAQAATLMAMKTAYENARDSSAKLRNEISRKRQKQVTTSVIETAAGGIEADG